MRRGVRCALKRLLAQALTRSGAGSLFPQDDPLFELDNVVLTPHVAGTMHETCAAAARQLPRILSGSCVATTHFIR